MSHLQVRLAAEFLCDEARSVQARFDAMGSAASLLLRVDAAQTFFRSLMQCEAGITLKSSAIYPDH
jgi:hypothetical protein